MAESGSISPSPSTEKPVAEPELEKGLTDTRPNGRRKSSVPRDDTALALLEIIDVQNPDHPIHWSPVRKWIIVTIYCVLQVFVTLTSTSYVSVEFEVQERFGGSTQVLTLGQSMFIVGNAVGPAFLGPLSDIGGRKWVYVGSIAMYAVLNIGTALADNLPMLIVFQFLCGAAGSTALTNVAGTIADLFGDADNAAQPMALFVAAANIGPSLGSPIGEWIAINPHMGWRWIFYLNIIIGGAYAFGLCFVPETLPKVVMTRAVQRHGSVDENAMAVAMGSSRVEIVKEIIFVATMALKIMLTEPIVMFLAAYNGWAYGLLFLYLDGVFEVFNVNNGLSDVGASLTYLNFAVGVTITFCFMPIQTWLYRRDRLKHGGYARPEARFLANLVTIWLFPISLFWFAFTSNGNVNYWSPIVAGGVLGFADPLLYIAMLNYITDSYPNVAASAVAAFLIPSFLLAAGFAHIGLVMLDTLGTTWMFACLAFLSLGIVGLVYGLYFFGPVLRKWSKLARTF